MIHTRMLFSLAKYIALGTTLQVFVFGATDYYFDYTAGNDANNGTSTATAKKRHFYMKGYSGPAYTHAAGDRFIFKGGVTWPNAAFQMNITAGGTAGSPDYYGADVTWYTGGSFTRPVFDYENTLIGAGWSLSAGVLVNAASGYIIIDNIEMKNHRAPYNGSDWGACTINYTAGSSLVVSNCLIKDWSLAAPVTDYRDGGGGGGIFGLGGNNIVIDGCEFHQAGQAIKTGRSTSIGGTMRNCTVHDTIMAFLGAGTVNDNLIYDLKDPTDLKQHANAIYVRAPSTISRNRIHDITPYAQVIYASPSAGGVTSGTSLIDDNVVWNVWQPCVALDMEAATSTSQIARILNNTLVGAGGSGTTIRVIYRGASQTWGTLDARNNHLITSGTGVGYNNPSAGFANVNTATVSDNITMTPTDATSYGYTAANAYEPVAATSPTAATTGADVSAICCATDIDGTARPPWEIGAYVYAGAPAPGVLTLSTNSYSASEEAGTITITVNRAGGTTGAATVNYATSNGTALDGVNYTSTSGTLNWPGGDSADKTFAVTLIDANTSANPTFTVTLSGETGATLGAPSAATVTVLGSGTPVDPLLVGLVWPAPSTLLAPFTLASGYYSQSVQTTDPATGGSARYRFTAPATGDYVLKAFFTNLTDSANSVFVDIDAEPTSPTAIWDQPYAPTHGTLYASWRGTGSDTMPETALKTWTLSAGEHTLIVRGREASTMFSTLTLEQVTPVGVATITTTSPFYYYKAADVIPIVVTFSDTVDVTGTPTLTLNSGATVAYTSGTGTAALTFSYTVGAADSATALDVTAINLPGGATIKNGATDAVLTVPSAGDPGSLSSLASLTIDTTAPTIAISAASATLTTAGATIYFTVTYVDDYFNTSTLTAANVTVNGVTATVAVSTLDNPSRTQTITLSALTVGTGTISIAASTASDYAGNLAPAAGPSASFVVTSMGGGTANVIATTAGFIYVRP